MTNPGTRITVQMTRPEHAASVDVEDFTHESSNFVAVQLGSDVSIFVRDLDTLHAIQTAFDTAERMLLADREGQLS